MLPVLPNMVRTCCVMVCSLCAVQTVFIVFEIDFFAVSHFQTACVIPWQYLEDGVVFAVNRQDGGAVLTGSFHKQCAGNHQRFFVCQINGFAFLSGGQSRGQTGRADNGTHHAADLISRSHINQGLRTI